MGRKPLGDAPLTPTERKRRQRAREREQTVTVSQNTVTKPKRDRVSELERRVEQLEKVIDRMLAQGIERALPPKEAAKEAAPIRDAHLPPPTDDEIKSFFYGAGRNEKDRHKNTLRHFNISWKNVDEALDRINKRDDEIVSLSKDNSLSVPNIANALGLTEGYVEKVLVRQKEFEARPLPPPHPSSRALYMVATAMYPQLALPNGYKPRGR